MPDPEVVCPSDGRIDEPSVGGRVPLEVYRDKIRLRLRDLSFLSGESLLFDR